MYLMPSAEEAIQFTKVFPSVIAGKTGRHTYTEWDQVLMGAAVGIVLLVLQRKGVYNTRLVFPFFKRLIPDLGLWYLPFATFALVAGCSSGQAGDDVRRAAGRCSSDHTHRPRRIGLRVCKT